MYYNIIVNKKYIHRKETVIDMKEYIKVSTGYRDIDRYVVVREGSKKNQIKNLRTGKISLVDVNEFLHDYILA
jgi:hypothetical protein